MNKSVEFIESRIKRLSINPRNAKIRAKWIRKLRALQNKECG